MKIRIPVAALGLALSLAGCGAATTTAEPAASGTASSETAKPAAAKPKPAAAKPKPVAAKPKPAGPQLTTAQASAKRSAESYLDYSGFSKKGLIDQLKFEGFSTKDSEVAIDTMKVNWNAEADESAKSYMEMSASHARDLSISWSSEGSPRSKRPTAQIP